MNFAIIELGGHQIWVEANQYFLTTKISTIPGTKIILNRILLISNYDTFYLGTPFLSTNKNKTNKIKSEIIEHLRGSKITVYKMKSKKKYRRKKGHRQEMTKLIIKDIKL
jgi:large subunit ribosomal protein L21